MRRTFAAFAVALLLAGLTVSPAWADDVQSSGCDVESATLEWGFKESFRAYIDGSIANGEWTVADGATYETPSFGFASTSGRVDPRLPRGSVYFAGSVRFTGHGGVLDTTIGTPVLVFSDTEPAVLHLDVSGPTMDGDEVSVSGASFVTVDLAGQDLTPVDGIITIDAAPTELTADGAVAFPNYAAGEAFDPVTITMDVGDCDLSHQPLATDAADDTSVEGMPWLIPAIGVLLLAVAAVVVAVIATHRRRNAG